MKKSHTRDPNTVGLSAAETVGRFVEAIPGERPTPVTAKRYAVKRMKPKHHAILTALLAGYSQVEVAQELGYTTKRIGEIVNSPIFQGYLRRIINARHEAVVSGEYGPIRQARAEAPQLMKGLLSLAKGARSENVRRMSTMDALAIAGYQPVTRTETVSLDKLIDDMEDDELRAYVDTGHWPARLADRARDTGRLSVAERTKGIIDITPDPPDTDEKP